MEQKRENIESEKTSSFSRDQCYSLTKALYPLIPLALLLLYLYPSRFSLFLENQILKSKQIIIPSQCDYSNGKWVPDKSGPMYNYTTCTAVREPITCILNGKPDMDYLYWRWKPEECKLPKFDPMTFLRLFKNKNLGFFGDSLARNQFESLLCLLSLVSTPYKVYKDKDNQNWHFPSHNITFTVLWSPVLVKRIKIRIWEKKLHYSKLYLDSLDHRWISEMGKMDLLIISAGRWFNQNAVFFEGGSILGCYSIFNHNCTQISYCDAYRKAIKNSLQAIIDQRVHCHVILQTYSPSHFEGGEWDTGGVCTRTNPFKEGENKLEELDAEMRKILVEEVEIAQEKVTKMGGLIGLRFQLLDVTKLSFMRPDGHPGPYRSNHTHQNLYEDFLDHDCVHWCVPGPIDTWNEMLLDVMKRWDM